MIKLDDNVPITLSIKGNYMDNKYNFYPTDVLFHAWRDYVGKEIDCENYGKRKVVNVTLQGEFIFVETIKSL